MGFHSPLIRPAISWGNVALRGVDLRFPGCEGLDFPFFVGMRSALLFFFWVVSNTLPETNIAMENPQF